MPVRKSRQEQRKGKQQPQTRTTASYARPEKQKEMGRKEEKGGREGYCD